MFLHINLHFGYTSIEYFGLAYAISDILTRCFCYKITFISGMSLFSNYNVAVAVVLCVAVALTNFNPVMAWSVAGSSPIGR